MSGAETGLHSLPESQIVRLLGDLVKTRSFNPPGDEAAIGVLVAERLRAAGLAVSLQAVSGTRRNVIGRLRGEGTRPALLLSAHLDTVPAGETPWRHDPLGAEIEAGRMYGRGSVDTKSSLAAMMAAADFLCRSHVTLQGDLILLATVGEETGCEGARVFEQSGGMEEVGALVIGEPTSLDLVVAHRGALWLELTVHGRAAHGSLPELGVNAIQGMCLLLDRLPRAAFGRQPDALLGSPTVNVGTIHGGIQPNIVPDLCRAAVDIRTVPGQSHAAILAEARSWAGSVADSMPGLSIEVLATLDIPSLVTASNAPLILAASDVMREQLGHAPIVRAAPYFTDGAVLAEARPTPTLICGPGGQELAHAVDEHVEIAQVIDAARFYVALAQRLLVSDAPMPRRVPLDAPP